MLHGLKKFLLYFLAFYTLFGFIGVPLVLKPQIIKAVAQQTNASIEIDSIFFNPFLFKLELSGIHLKDQQSKELFSLASAFVDVEVYSLFRAAVHIKDLTLEEPKVYLIYDADKKLNFASLLKENNETQETNSSDIQIPRIIVNSFKISNGYVHYEDFTQTNKFDFSLDGLGFELKDLDTKDLNMSKASLRFYSHLGDGGFVDLKSNIVAFDPFIVSGTFDFEASKLYTQYRYLQDILNLEVADGKLSAHAEYFFNMDDLNATKIQNASLYLDNLRIKPKDANKDILNLGALHLDNIAVAPMQKQVFIEKVQLDSLWLKVLRNAKGEIDWMRYVKVDLPPSDANETQNAAEEELPWNVLVQDIALEKIKADFHDKGISPTVDTKLNNLNLYAQNLTLAGEEPLIYSTDFTLNDAFVCHSNGTLKHAKLDINASAKCDGFDIVHYAPYIDAAAKEALEVYNIKLIRATAGFDAKLQLKTQGEQMFINVTQANLRLANVALNKRSTGEKLLAFKDFNVEDTAIDLQKKEVNIAKTTLADLEIQTKMFANGAMNFEGLVEAKKEQESKEEAAFRVKLKHFALDAAKVNFEDATLSPSASLKVDRIFANVYDIDSKEGTWLKYKTYMRINSKGIMRANGDLRHTPLSQKGTLDLSDFSLKEFNPYLAQSTYLKIDDGAIDINVKTAYDTSSSKADAKISGVVKLKEFFLADSRDDSSLLSVGELALRGFELNLMPNRLYVNEADLNAFYVDAMIDDKKVMNFATLMKENAAANQAQEKAPATKKSDAEAGFAYKIEKLNLNSGSAKFADFSLPIRFQTNIHDLSGSVLSISNTPSEVTHVDVKGEVDAYGSTKLKGSLESANPKKFMDLNLNFKNLDLNAMSGYSAAFAGYTIESGKLYLDLGYKIKDSELLGSNNITINKIKLGEEIKDENTSSLPLGFVIALLEDSEGVIDIDMPVEGNVDAPDFKYGALVMKTLGNLILKAVASPFSFLGSVMGIDSQKLEYISFEPGKSEILPPQREKLDQIIKMFEKRPKISLSLSGVYDLQSDTKALQLEKLTALAIKESGAKSKEEQQNAVDIDVLEDIYEDIKDDDKLDKIRDALEEKYKDDEFKREYLKALIEETRVLQVVSKTDLEALATLRTQTILSYLVQEQRMDAKKIHTAEIKAIDEPQNSSVRMKLAVDVQ